MGCRDTVGTWVRGVAVNNAHDELKELVVAQNHKMRLSHHTRTHLCAQRRYAGGVLEALCHWGVLGTEQRL